MRRHHADAQHNPAEGRLRVVRQIACNAPDPPAPQTVIQSVATVKERQWIPIWVNQKLSGQANSGGVRAPVLHRRLHGRDTR